MQVTRKELDDLYNRQKLSTTEIGAHLGVPGRTVRWWMDKFGLLRRSRSESRRAQLDNDAIERLYVIERLSAIEIGQRLGVSVSVIYKRLEERNVARRDLSEAKTVYPRCDFSGDLVEKAYLVGFRQGDLHVRMNKDGPACASIYVSTGSTRIEQINLFHELFSPYGHVNVSSPGSNGNHDVACLLNLSFDFLLPKVDAMSEWILCSTENDNDMRPFLAFLAGYTDAEGCFGVWAGSAAFSLRSYQVNILTQLQAVLDNRLSIRCPPACLLKPKGFRTRRGVEYHGDYWQLAVYRKVSLYRLCELLEPYLKHAKRRADMFAVKANVMARGI